MATQRFAIHFSAWIELKRGAKVGRETRDAVSRQKMIRQRSHSGKLLDDSQ